MPNSPVLWGPNSIANNLQSKIIQSTGELIENNGLKNYINYNNFENQLTTGWSLGTTGTLTNGIPTGTPTFGSGASGNLSISISTSSPISGLASLSMASSAATTAGDMLATDSLAIDTADQAKVLTYKFYYSVPSNPSNGNFSGTSSNSFGVACYDVTNSSWLPVAGNFAMTQNSGVGIATGTMQTNSNTANIRFIVYNANASAGAITVNFDSFYLGPQTTNIGPVVTDWQSYTPTISGLGTATGVSFFYRRVGDSVEIAGSMVAGTVTGSNVSISLPSGLAVDTSKTLTLMRVGDVSVATSSVYAAMVDSASSTTVFYVYNNNIDTKLTGTNWGSSNKGGINAIIPIQGWSSNVQMSNDTDTRVIAARMDTTTGTVLNGSGVKIDFNGVFLDTCGMASIANDRMTVPVSGVYKIRSLNFLSGTTGERAVRTDVKVNGTTSYQVALNVKPATTTGTSWTIYGEITLKLNVGDYVEIFGVDIAGSTTVSSGSYFEIERVSGPSVIAASETVACDYNTAAGQSIPNNTETILDFGTKVYDTHGSVTTGASWKFTAPVSGLYSVQSLGTWAAASWTVNQITRMSLYKNGALYRRLASQQAGNTLSHQLNPCAGSTTLQMNAGDYIYITAYQNQGGAVSMLASADSVYVSITRVGN